MRRTFRTANLIVSVLVVVIGIVMIALSRSAPRSETGVYFAIGVFSVIYGITRFLLYLRFGRPNQ